MTKRKSNAIWAILWTLFIILLLYSGVLIAGIVLYGNAEVEEPDIRVSIFSDDGYMAVRVDEIPESEWRSYGVSSDAVAAYRLNPSISVYDEEKDRASYADIGGYGWSYSYTDYLLQGDSSYDGDITEARDFGGEVWNEEGNPVSKYMEFYVENKKVGDDGYVADVADSWWISGNGPVPETIAVCYEPFGTPINLRLSVWDWAGGQTNMTVRFDYAAKPSAEEFTVYSGTDEEEEIIFKARYDDFEDAFEVDESSYDKQYEDEEYLYCSYELASKSDSRIRTEITKREYTTGTVCIEPDREDEWSMGISYNGITALSGEKSVSWGSLSNALFGTQEGFADIPTSLLGYSACRHYDRSQTKSLLDTDLNTDSEPMMTLVFRHETSSGASIRFSIGLSFYDYDGILVGAGDVYFVDQDGNPVTGVIIG